MKKKWAISSMVLATALVASACSSSSSSSNSGTSKESTKKETSKDVEIFSWWTGAGEADGLEALLELTKDKYPDINVINSAVAGGAGTNAKTVLATRMQGGDPPGTFQVHGGAELNDSWVKADKMESLNDLYSEQEWADKFPQSLIDMVSKDGNIYSVPVNIHRGNVLWYNQKVFDQYNLKAPTTFDEFFQVADALKEKGVTPLSLGDKEPWTATMLFEDVLLGTIGAENYNKIWSGEISLDDAKVKEALTTFKKMLTYVNKDHAARNWQDAAQLVVKGEAAMNVMGDWEKGYFANDFKLKANVDYGWITTPGTSEDFMVITDTFGLPKGAKNPEKVKEFLAILGSKEGQDVFNPLKGSIPARTDADTSKYDEYGKQTIAEFKEAKLAPSLAHGSAASEAFLSKVNQIINIFVSQGNVDDTAKQLKQAQVEVGIISK